MKKIFFLCAVWCLPLSFAYAGPEAVCSLLFSKKVIKIASAHSVFDKNRHCSVSCMLTLRCPSVDVMAAGVLKEVKDLIGPGNAEMEDLYADVMGIDLADKKVAQSDQQCLSQCDLYFAP